LHYAFHGDRANRPAIASNLELAFVMETWVHDLPVD
jgi:hypothetical protein